MTFDPRQGLAQLVVVARPREVEESETPMWVITHWDAEEINKANDLYGDEQEYRLATIIPVGEAWNDDRLLVP